MKKKNDDRKMQQKGILFKNLLASGYTLKQITKKWGYKKQMISYWKKNYKGKKHCQKSN